MTTPSGPAPVGKAARTWPRAAVPAAVIGAGLLAAIIGPAIADAAPVPGLSPGVFVRAGIPVARFLLDIGAAVVVGIALLPKLLGFRDAERTEPVLAGTRPYAVAAAVVWTAAALISILLLTAELAPGEIVTPAAVWRYIVAVPAGKGLVLSAASGALSWLLAHLAVRFGEKVPAELRVGVGLFGLLPLPLTGHAANWYYHDLSMVTMELHITGSTLWAGGLAVLVVVLARHRELLAVALPKFSRLATWCFFIVALTGIANGLIELWLSPIVSLPESLWQTRYGVMLLAKGVCLGAVGLIALRVRARIMPMVAAGKRSAFAFWCGWEISVLSIAFAVAVVLTRAEVTPF